MGAAIGFEEPTAGHNSKGNGSAVVAGLAGSVRVERLAFQRAAVSSEKSFQRWVARLSVSCYRVAGMAVLVFILLGLGSYLALILFYAVNASWVAPQIISPTDEHVLQLNSQLAQGTWLREKLSSDRLELMVRLRDAMRQSAGTKRYQGEFRRSVEQLRSDEGKKLAAIVGVAASYGSAAPQILRTQDEYLSVSQSETERLYQAHLIDNEEYLSRKHQLSTAKLSGLSLQRDGTETEQASKALDREVQSYDQILKAPNGATNVALSYEVLREKREYDSAVLEQARALDLTGAIQAEIGVVEREIARQDELIEAIRVSPYLRAAKGNLTVAHLPYGNGGEVGAGVPVYGCALGIVLCHRVGQVTEVLAGEVVGKHPFYSKDLRGVLIQMQIDEPQWARKRVLFLNRAPLFF
jgi:hypothetical protein